MTRSTARQGMTAARRHSKPTPGGDNRVRIVAGQYRGRWIEFPDVPGLRPTGNRVRETLFNWLGQRLDGLRCLDLFAGSGALGFEAASRGAAEVVMVETDRGAILALKRNRERLGAQACRIEGGDALALLARSTAQFDLIFLDPPFASGFMARALALAHARLAKDGRVYCEWGDPLDALVADPAAGAWQVVRSGKAGVVHFALLAPRESAP